MQTAYKALPTSKKEIAEYARSIRRRLGLENEYYFPVVKFLELVLPGWYEDMTLDIVLHEKMLFKEGETIPGQNTIRIREDIYNDACVGGRRARFTVAHEIGHFLLHTPDSIALCRMKEGTKFRPFEDPEWQANTFAGELLAPGYLITGLSIREVMEQCGVSEMAAGVALDKCWN